MLALDVKNPLLLEIKSAITKLLPATSQANDQLVISDKLRQDILTRLIGYSDSIPHPASGIDISANATLDHSTKINSQEFRSKTLCRWQILAYVASIDLTIAKWFESHLDALSILHEVGHDKSNQGLWAVWAAEGHPDPLRHEQGKVSGKKAWCSGAHIVDHGLMTYRDEHGQSQLLTVDMNQGGIDKDHSGWQAVGMQATDTATLQFQQVTAIQVGTSNAYLERVGFWHGAAGVAACWYGAAVAIADYLIMSYQNKPNAYKAMYLGQIASALAVTQQYLYHVAWLIDTQPQQSHELAIRQLRCQAEQVARQVIDVVGQALGAAPFCNNAHFARLVADLSVFIRQSHGAFDLQKIGELSSASTSANNSIDEQVNIWQL